MQLVNEIEGKAQNQDGSAEFDPLSRNVYCILGLPIDSIDLTRTTRIIRDAARARRRLLVSTPNLNFAVLSQTNSDFRDSLVLSDLCPPDGAAIIWIARLLGLPIRTRVAGSDFFEALKGQCLESPLNVFFFGGEEGNASLAAKRLNAVGSGLRCAGWLYPGWGSLEEMSADKMITAINQSNADFLVVALGAAKGQEWLRRNHGRITIPVRSHLGAVLNLQAGVIQRAPVMMRHFGMEWLWRIKEEPHLWRRYWSDGVALLRLFLKNVIPLALYTIVIASRKGELAINTSSTNGNTLLRFQGSATAAHISLAIQAIRAVVDRDEDLTLDLGEVDSVDQRFIGLLLVARKELHARGHRMTINRISSRSKRLLLLNNAKDLLTPPAFCST